MSQTLSIAIETSCRQGGVALGCDDQLLEVIDFDASSRHATQLVKRLSELLTRHDLRPADLGEVYVSAGPGSFTGVRVGITVARTLAQAVPDLRCAAVPSALAVAQNALGLQWRHLGVVLDAKDELAYTQLFERAQAGEPLAAAPPAVQTMADFLAKAPRPLLLIGEGLGYHKVQGIEGVSAAGASLNYPRPAGVWRAGRQLANQGQFVDYRRLLPVYARKSEAERLWDLRHGA